MPKNEFLCDCTAVHQEAVDQVLAQMPCKQQLQQVAEFYKLLGDPTRCKILCALLSQELCVCDLANVLSMTKSSISHQLRKLRTMGAVKCRRDGKEVYYSLDDHHVRDIFSLTMTHLEHKEAEYEK